MGYKTKLSLDNSKFEQCATHKITLSGCSEITGTITSNSGYQIGGITILRTSVNEISTIRIGKDAGNSTATGCNNFAVGCQALVANTIGSNNIAIGYQSLNKLTSANHNYAFGYQALYCTTSGCNNFAAGYQALCRNGSGCNNNAIGNSVLSLNVGGCHNIGQGNSALNKNSSGSGNIALGSCAFFNNTTGNNNIGIGQCSGYVNSTGNNNIFIGACAGYGELGSGKLYIATGMTRNLIYGDFVANIVTLPTLCLCTTPAAGSASDVLMVWNSIDKQVKCLSIAAISGGSTTVTANNGLTKSGTNVRLGGVLTGNTTIDGAYALNVCGGAKLNTQCGYQISGTTMFRTGSVLSNIFIGQFAGSSGSGIHNFGVGCQALYSNTIGSANIAQGQLALYSNTSGSNNIALGNSTLYLNTTGSDNIALGALVLNKNTSGSDNIAQGCHALYYNVTGCNNIAQGSYALDKNTTGCDNIAQGSQGLNRNTLGSNNIAQGKCALFFNTTGSNNISIGQCSGYQTITGNSNVYIGNYAGSGNTTSNRLYIANSKACTLIYGEFDNKIVKIGGNLCIDNDIILASGVGHTICIPTTTSAAFPLNIIGQRYGGAPAGGLAGAVCISGGCSSASLGNACGGDVVVVGGHGDAGGSATGSVGGHVFINGGAATTTVGAATFGGFVWINGGTGATMGGHVCIAGGVGGLACGNVSLYSGTQIKLIASSIGVTVTGTLGASGNICSTAAVCSATCTGVATCLTVGTNILLTTGAPRLIYVPSIATGTLAPICILGQAVTCTTGAVAGAVCIIGGGSTSSSGIATGGGVSIIGGCGNFSSAGIGGAVNICGGGIASTGTGGGVNICGATGTTSGVVNIYSGAHLRLNTNAAGVCITGALTTSSTICSTSDMCATNFILTSDCRLKTCIVSIPLSPISIEYKQFELIAEPNQIRYGAIAQELQIENPELVRINEDGMLSVAYIDLLIKEIAYLKYKVSELEKRME